MQSRASGIQQHRRPALIGRSRERVFLREELMQAFAGHGQLVLVGGEAGIGKTTLVRDLLQDSEANAATRLFGQCYDLTNTPPYGPWLDLFASYEPCAGLPDPPLAFAGGRLDEIGDQARLYAELREFLNALSARTPVLLMLEDLHWADPASLELLRHIGSRIGTLRILLLLTYRVDELTRANPFYQQLPALIRESQGLRLDLRGLAAEELRMLVRSRWQLPEADEERLVRYLVAHSEGNPFFATEMLRSLEEEGIIGSTGAGDGVAEIDHFVVPSLLRQVIESRIDRLGEDARSHLAVASVIGQDVPLDLWGGVAGMGDEAALDLIDRAVEAHVLEAGRSGTHVTFVHALTRAALYESILPPRRRGLHRQIADALIAGGTPDPDVIAYHLVQSGDSRAIDWLTLAGDRAHRAYAWLTAQERFAEAAALLEGVTGEEQTRGWLLYRLARLQRYSGSLAPLATFEEAERLGKQTGDVLLATDSWHSRGIFRCFAGDFELGLEEQSSSITEMEAQLDTITQRSAERIPWMADSLPAVKAHELEGPDPAIDMLKRQGMHHRRGGIPWFLAMAGRIAEAQTMASVFVAAAESAAAMGNWVRSAVGHAYQGLANAAAIRGEPSEARSAFERGRQLYASLDHHAAIGFSLLIELHECAIPFETRDVARRKKLAGAAAAALGRAGGTFPPGLSPERANLSIHFLEGHWDTARAIADDVPIHGTVLLRREVTTNISAIARAQGRLDEAWELVHLALPKGVDTIPGSTLFPESTELQLTAAHLSLDEGNLVQAREWLDAHDRWMAWSGAVLGRAEGLTGWARYYHSAGDEQEAMRFAAEALAAASEPDQPLATIAALRQFGELEASANHPDRSVAHLREALALAITCELVYEEALTRASLALVYQATNDLAATNEELRPARSIAERLDARPLLERLAGIARETTEQIEHIPAGLTPREIQVLRLVAQGMTDAAIGEALFISTRTASQHLRSIYSKLNVSSRAAATRFAIEHGLA